MTSQQRGGVDTCIGYLQAKRELLGNDTALARGRPIATGVIEGACRHLTGDRLDITGARWGLQGAEAILKLRALCSNGDFNTSWAFHLTHEHRRVHQARYQHPPPVQPDQPVPEMEPHPSLILGSWRSCCAPGRRWQGGLGRCRGWSAASPNWTRQPPSPH